MSTSQTAAVPATATSTREPSRRMRWALPATTILLARAWLSAKGGLYTPGDDIGYALGVAGGVMMLTLLLYPLRKHVRLLQPLGAIRHWFKLHMLFGILGPLLIVLHSTFRIGSLNAGVALGCMLLVAGSGVIGRFMYTRIHHGLYGRKATLEEMHAQLGMCEGEVQSRFHFAINVEARLKTFGAMAQTHPEGFLAASWQFLTIGLRARRVHSQCMRELRRILGGHAAQRGWSRDKLHQRLRGASALIAAFLDAARKTSQFSVYERLFSLWHILHVPFVFMLVISGVVHVIAVHMY